MNVVVWGFRDLRQFVGRGLVDALMNHPKETNKNLKIRSGSRTCATH
ncbi:MAG: hypothetical protein QW309_06530 [Zestosphaera sp.]